jgi:DNA-binding FrmR family transcriptional regulator
MMDADTKRKAFLRLRRIEGQVQGVQRMLEDDKYCVDVLMQIAAIQGALEQVSKIVMTRHIESCVVDSLRPGSERERARKIEELFRVFSRHSGFGAR